MPTELVLLTDAEPTRDQWAQAATAVVRGGSIATYVGEVHQILDRDAHALVSWWPARVLQGRREAVAEVGPAAASARYWIDVVLSPAGERSGREIAARVADAVGGTLTEGRLA